MIQEITMSKCKCGQPKEITHACIDYLPAEPDATEGLCDLCGTAVYGINTCADCRSEKPDATARARALEDAKAFKRVAIELRIRFPVEIQYNSEFEAIVKRLEGGSL